MRSAIVRSFVGISLAALMVLGAGCGSPKKSETTDAPPQPSAVGKAAGDAVTKTIGATGGTLSSGDGRVSLTVPAGALAADVGIAIQPIENTAAGGLGLAYRFSPAGQTFTKPVQFSFPYVDADLAGTVPEALGIAFQDAQGRWESQSASTVDTAAKVLTVTSTHFSDWSTFAGIQLRPPSAAARVNQQVTLTAKVCVQRSIGGLAFLRYSCDDVTDELAELAAVKAATWSVNGTVGGGATTGTVKGNKGSGVFTAPAKKPAGKGISTVSVEAALRGKKMVLLANVTIYEGYHVVGKFEQTNTGLVCAGTVSPSITDMVEFSLKAAGNSFTLTDIKNSDTHHGPVTTPVVDLKPTVTSEPEILVATGGTVDATGGNNLITVSVKGATTVGVCKFGGAIVGTGQTGATTTGLTFYTDKFVDGTQVGVPEDVGDRQWTWVVTVL